MTRMNDREIRMKYISDLQGKIIMYKTASKILIVFAIIMAIFDIWSFANGRVTDYLRFISMWVGLFVGMPLVISMVFLQKLIPRIKKEISDNEVYS
jgi:hypothetical protein